MKKETRVGERELAALEAILESGPVTLIGARDDAAEELIRLGRAVWVKPGLVVKLLEKGNAHARNS